MKLMRIKILFIFYDKGTGLVVSLLVVIINQVSRELRFEYRAMNFENK
jgi:hypothetical protein